MIEEKEASETEIAVRPALQKRLIARVITQQQAQVAVEDMVALIKEDAEIPFTDWGLWDFGPNATTLVRKAQATKE